MLAFRWASIQYSSQFSYFTMRDLLSRLSTISPFCFPRSNNDRVFCFCFINDDCMAELLSLTDLKIPSSRGTRLNKKKVNMFLKK